MKKMISLLLAITLCLSLCACGNTPQQNNQPEGSIEDALEQWPWIVDEWHTLYFAEEPVVVFAEDGSFQHGDESGTWTWDSMRGGDNHVVPLTIYPDDGDSYLLTFYVEESFVRILAENAETGEYLYEEEVRSSESAAPDLAKCDAVIGEWVSLENEFGYSGELPFMDIREDGTCTILGEDGVWGLPDSQRDAEKVNYLLIKTAGKEYSIEIVYEHYYDNPGYGCVYVVNGEAEPMEFAYAMNLRFPAGTNGGEATEPDETIQDTGVATDGESAKIIGEWKATNENCSLFFYEDGTCVEGKSSPCEWYYDESTKRYCIFFEGMTVSFVIETENGIRSLSSLGMFSPCSYVHADDYEKAVEADK